MLNRNVKIKTSAPFANMKLPNINQTKTMVWPPPQWSALSLAKAKGRPRTLLQKPLLTRLHGKIPAQDLLQGTLLEICKRSDTSSNNPALLKIHLLQHGSHTRCSRPEKLREPSYRIVFVFRILKFRIRFVIDIFQKLSCDPNNQNSIVIVMSRILL